MSQDSVRIRYSQFIFREPTQIASQQPGNPVRELIPHRFSAREAAEVYRLLGEPENADYDSDGDVHRDMIGVLLEWM